MHVSHRISLVHVQNCPPMHMRAHARRACARIKKTSYVFFQFFFVPDHRSETLARCMYIIPCQQSKENRGNSLTISNDDRFRPRSLKCPGNEKQTPTGLTYLRLCSNRPQANQSRWIPYIHYNRPQTGRRAAFDRSPRARRPLTVKSRPARNLAGRDRNLRMRSALLLRVSSLYRSTQSRNRMSITSKFDPHHSPSHHTTSRSYADCYLNFTLVIVH